VSQRRVVVIHGYTANPEVNWFRWLQRELAADGIAVEIPALPDPQAPDRDAWVAAARAAIGAVDGETVIVGHSLGSITSLHVLDGLEEPWTLAGIVLVSGFDREVTGLPVLAPFTAAPPDVAAMVDRIATRVVIASDDDEIVDPALSAALAGRLDAELVTVPGGGHFLDRQGYVEFPQLAAIVRGAFG